MKLLTSILVLSCLTLPVLAQAHDEGGACKEVFEACSAQGYTKDENAPAGKKIWANCANVILNKKKAVEKVDIDPNGFDAKNCREYREAKDKFDADWAKNHKKPS